MIIVKLMGGLGNQMFQYAAARRLAYIRNTPVRLDVSWFNNIENIDTSRRYELHVFNIKEDFVLSEEVENFKRVKKGVFSRALKKLTSAVSASNQSTWIRERYFHFDPAILKLPDNVYLEGYWQSEKYFLDSEWIIRKEFAVRTEPGELNRQIAEIIKNTESISVHVRRGDYVTNPTTSQYHGSCSTDYYCEAVGKVVSQVQHPHFFIFSDEPDWVRENITLPFPVTYIDHNGADKACEDMRLISLCKHHIIANSSFSWWGAWLCANPDKMVFAPKKWFNKTGKNTADLLPDSWHKI